MSPISTWSRCYRHWATPIVVIALLVGSLAPPLATPVSAVDYVISGTVTGPDGAPLVGIGVRTGTDSLDVWTSTGFDGTYSFAVLPGDYRLWFYDWSSIYAQGCNASSGFTTDQNACTTVSVTTSDVTGIDVQIPLGLHISGRVTGPDGAPLANIGIETSNGAWTNTASDGYFSVTVVPGDYTLLFDDNTGAHVSGCYSSSGLAADGFLAEGGADACTPVSVTTADMAGIDVVMPIGWRLSGRVTGPGGTPLANIGVGAYDGTYQFMTSTRADGTYSRTLLPGDYTLHFGDKSGTYVNGCYSSSGFTPDEYACTLVSVTTADVTGIDVVMPLGRHITGTVTGPGGTPLANIGVRAGTDTFEVWTNTGADGTYSFKVPAGDYMLSFHDDSSTYVDGCYSSDGFTTDQNACTPLSVPPDATGIDVVMPLGLHITGTVTEAGGTALANIGIWASAGNFGTGTRTDSNGTYSLTVPPGSYILRFLDSTSTYVNGCYASSGFGSYATDQNSCTPVSVSTADVSTGDVVMPVGLHISGRVTGSDGLPLADIGVGYNQADSDYFWIMYNTDSDGNYSISVLPGDYVVSFYDFSSTHVDGCYSSSGFTTDQNSCTPVTVSVTTGDVTGIDVVMPLAGATPVGTDVAVVPADSTSAAQPVLLVFSNVNTAGTTTLTTSTTAPALPAGYQVGDSPIYFDLQTTATYTGSITVCISYGNITPGPTSLLHYESAGWTDITTAVDTANQMVCGVTMSLGPFALATWAPPVLTVPSNVIATATGSTGAVVTYSATALDSAGTPLTPACTKASGTTFPVGTTTVTCSATDTKLRTSSASFTVTVGYGFAGFFQPLNDPIYATNPMSVFKDGSTIPVKFALTYANGTPILDTAAAAIATGCGATISLAQTSGTAGPVDEVVTSTTPNSGSCFRYDATAQQFIFNLGTKGLPTGTQYLLKVSIVGPDIVGPDKTLRPTHTLVIGLR